MNARSGKTCLTGLAILFFSFSLIAQESEVRSVSSFDGISVAASVDAELVKGSTNQVEITVKGMDLEDVKTEVKNGVLRVGIKSKKMNWSWGKGKKATAVITYTDTPGFIGVSSSADVTSRDKIVADELELSASSSGDMNLEIDVNKLKVSVSSSADLTVSGSADEAKVTVSSSGDFLGKGLTAGSAHVTASSSGDAELRVTNSLEATASSSGDIIYYGNPGSKDVNKSSGGSVSQKN